MATKSEKLLGKAKAFERKGKPDKALELYRELCELEPYDPDLWQARGEAAHAIGRVEEATEALFRVCDLYARGGMPVEALRTVRRVLEVDHNHGGARRLQHMLEARLGVGDDERPAAVAEPARRPRPAAQIVEDDDADYAAIAPAPPSAEAAELEPRTLAAAPVGADHAPADLPGEEAGFGDYDEDEFEIAIEYGVEDATVDAAGSDAAAAEHAADAEGTDDAIAAAVDGADDGVYSDEDDDGDEEDDGEANADDADADNDYDDDANDEDDDASDEDDDANDDEDDADGYELADDDHDGYEGDEAGAAVEDGGAGNAYEVDDPAAEFDETPVAPVGAGAARYPQADPAPAGAVPSEAGPAALADDWLASGHGTPLEEALERFGEVDGGAPPDAPDPAGDELVILVDAEEPELEGTSPDLDFDDPAYASFEPATQVAGEVSVDAPVARGDDASRPVAPVVIRPSRPASAPAAPDGDADAPEDGWPRRAAPMTTDDAPPRRAAGKGRATTRGTALAGLASIQVGDAAAIPVPIGEERTDSVHAVAEGSGPLPLVDGSTPTPPGRSLAGRRAARVRTGPIGVHHDAALETIPLAERLLGDAPERHPVEIPLDDHAAGERLRVLLGAAAAQPFVGELDRDLIHHLIDCGELLHKGSGEVVFCQGDLGTSLYFVLRGEVEVTREDEAGERPLARLRAGAFFGEMALLANSTRTATVTTTRASELLRITRPAVRALVERDPRLLRLLLRFFRARLVGTLLATSTLFRGFSVAERVALVRRFRLREAAAGARVIVEGAATEGLCVTLAGRLEVVARDGAGAPVVLGALGPGDVFGEMALLDGSPAMATVRADTRSWILVLPRADFDALVAEHPEIRDELARVAEGRRDRNRALLAGSDARVDLVTELRLDTI